MSKNITRRNFLTYAGYGLIATTAGSGLLSKAAMAAEGEKISLDNPMAKALGYVESTTLPDQSCDNCMHAKGEPGAALTPCALFQNKLVTKDGWCKAWVKK